MTAWTTKRGWLLPAVLILFLLEVLLMPLALGQTYAGRSESPDHTLTYETGSLTWDSATGIDPNGAAQLSLFGQTEQNVLADNGDRVIAPGTGNTSIVRLHNNSQTEIGYVAVMYRIKQESTLPVAPTLAQDNAFTDTDTYPLPDGVTRDQVVCAVTGSVQAGQVQDFDLSWSWNYYESDARDQLDTALGNRAAWATPDEVTAGIYIVVEEENTGGTGPDDPTDPTDPTDPVEPTDPDGQTDPDDPGKPARWIDGGSPDEEAYITPTVPKTGDNSRAAVYLALMGISGAVLVLLVLERRRENRS